MRFSVVACPHCRRAQAIESRFDRVGCVGCRKPLTVRELKVFFRGDREADARMAVMKVGAQIHGMDEAELARVLASLEPEPRATVEDVVNALAPRSEFTPEDFALEMRRMGAAGDPHGILLGLRRDNRVFEPREGRYRVV